MKTIIEVLLVVGAFSQSIWLGIFTLGYIFYIREEYKRLKDQLEAALSEEEVKQPEPEIKGTAIQIYAHKNCVIEEHKGSFFKIITPSSEVLDKVFFSLEEAEKEIDKAYPYLAKTKRERQKIYNIRHVR